MLQVIGRTLEAPIPEMSGLVRTNDLFSKAFTFIYAYRKQMYYVICCMFLLRALGCLGF